MRSRVRSLVNSPFTTGFLGAVGAFTVQPEWWIFGFLAGFYGLNIIRVCIGFVRGIRADGPQQLLDLMSDNDPALPLTVMGVVFGTAYAVWWLEWVPWLPVPGEAWTSLHVVVGALGFVFWFAFGGFVLMLVLFGLGDGFRRLLGKKGLEW